MNFILLVGTQVVKLLGSFLPFLSPLQTSRFTISCGATLGHLACIELDKQPCGLFPVDTWFPDKIEVKSNQGPTYIFPIYRWISDTEKHWFCEASGLWRSAVVQSTTHNRPNGKSDRPCFEFKTVVQFLTNVSFLFFCGEKGGVFSILHYSKERNKKDLIRRQKAYW